MYGRRARIRPGGVGVEDAAGRVVVERRPDRVVAMLLSCRSPDVGAADPAAGIGRARRRSWSGHEQRERVAAGGDQDQAQVRVAGVNDVDP